MTVPIASVFAGQNIHHSLPVQSAPTMATEQVQSSLRHRHSHAHKQSTSTTYSSLLIFIGCSAAFLVIMQFALPLIAWSTDTTTTTTMSFSSHQSLSKSNGLTAIGTKRANKGGLSEQHSPSVSFVSVEQSRKDFQLSKTSNRKVSASTTKGQKQNKRDPPAKNNDLSMNVRSVVAPPNAVAPPQPSSVKKPPSDTYTTPRAVTADVVGMMIQSNNHVGSISISNETSATKASITSKTASRTDTNTNETEPVPNYHIAFSTSCNEQQHWESMVFFYHAYKVKQRGTVTRILSGCETEKESQDAQTFFDKYIRPLAPDQFFLHMTPDFSRIALAEGKHSYKYMNKPYGLKHWMEHSLGMVGNLQNVTNSNTRVFVSEDDIVFLMDPDMILLRPIVHDFRDTENYIFAEKEVDPSRLVVRHGHPMAQQDGYLDSSWQQLNMSYITQLSEGQYVKTPSRKDGPLHWNTGPPYIMTVRDAYNIALKWADYAPRVLDLYPELFAEMYGYITATVQLELPHTLIKSLVVSDSFSQ
jgi:hypothetical protein